MDIVEDILRHPVAGPSTTLGHPVPGVGQPCPRQPKRKCLAGRAFPLYFIWPRVNYNLAFSIEHTWPATIAADSRSLC